VDSPSDAPHDAADSGAPGVSPTTVVRFGPGVAKPVLVSQAPMVFTREAYEHNVGGIALVKCIIELDGSVSQCRIVKGLPYMNEAILGSVSRWRYTPVLYKGHPQRVEMVIPVRVHPPAAASPRDQHDVDVDGEH
jgi:protein TonB